MKKGFKTQPLTSNEYFQFLYEAFQAHFPFQPFQELGSFNQSFSTGFQEENLM